MSRRIALLGFMLETNGFAPPATEEEFREKCYLEGEALLADLAQPAPRASAGLSGFIDAMDAAGPWEKVAILFTTAGASGPAEQGFFERCLAKVEAELKGRGPFDGVYCCQHGAAGATEEQDADGVFLARVRAAVGPGVPVVATLDLHANLSPAMVASTDLLCAYLTNPHVDQYERGQEAGRAMLEMLAGMRTARAYVHLPILPPSVALLTKHGPYADAINYGQTLVGGPILNVSAIGNFSLADSPRNGLSVVVTARGTGPESRAAADRAACAIAQRMWDDRERFVAKLTSIEDCTAMMLAACRDPSRPSLLFADVADNPGGGARGNTTWLLKAFHAAGVTGCAFGIHYDVALAAEAHERGEGARFLARLNRDETSPYSEPFEAEAVVEKLSDGTIIGRRGTAEGRTMKMGKTALLRIGGLQIVVVSVRNQALDPMQFEHLGIDVAALRGLVLKSRGHFRAGFDIFFSDDRIIEADCPGLVTPVLTRVPFRHIPRPMWPFEPDLQWTPKSRIYA